MKRLQQDIQVRFKYQVHFTENLFEPENPLLKDLIAGAGGQGHKVLFVVDQGVCRAHPLLLHSIEEYCSRYKAVLKMQRPPIVVQGGESAKNSLRRVRKLHQTINEAQLCKHSFVIVVGGGAVIDMVGFAAATAHRGLRLIRVPTTILSQNDSAVGVKSSINAFGKKNFLGTFTPPYAVLNDSSFLVTLSDRDWRSGIAEAIKVGLIKDAAFFEFLEQHAPALAARDMASMQQLIYRCADLHVQHIAQSGDPFEFGSSRPLDYGHWSAHKLEQLTKYKLRHGEAVAIGIALDTTYSYLAGFLPEDEWQRVIGLLAAIGFALYVPQLSEHLAQPNDPRCILHGLAEFREHLGGELTIMLLEAVGRSFEVHNVDFEIVKRSIRLIENLSQGGHTPKVASSSEPQICLNGGRYGLPVQYVPTKPAAVSR